MVERYLEREGFTVEVRADGEQGLDRALSWLPDLVVLDLMLPGLDGLEVCRRLRDVAPIPVVMLTARASRTTASPAWSSAPTTTSPSPSRPAS